MESRQQEDASDEDIRSDFFDDFSKDEFIEGLSVIDSWDVKETEQSMNSKSRITEEVDGVQDLRELISSGRDGIEMRYEKHDRRYKGSKYRDSYDRHSDDSRRDTSFGRLGNYIKPSSRRDLHKSIKAIKKDKEVKVKEYQSKHLDSMEDIRPPGTKIDDFLNESSYYPKKRIKSKSPEKYMQRHRRTNSPQRYNTHHSSTHRYMHKQYYRHASPQDRYRNSSPNLRQRRLKSPYYTSKRHSKTSPSSTQRSSLRYSRHHSGTPVEYLHKENQKCLEYKDSFLYPNEICQTVSRPPEKTILYETRQEELNAHTASPKYLAETSGYSCRQNSAYPSSYNYGPQLESTNHDIVQSVSASSMVPHPTDISSVKPQEELYDALAKMVVEGKLSEEDYLKIVPNKGTHKPLLKAKVLSRCLEALTKLDKLKLPNRLVLNNALNDQETKSLIPKYCSPLKRQAIVDFQFTHTSGKLNENVYRNKQVIESVISTIGLSDVVHKINLNNHKNVKDVAVQTTKPLCDMCHIRESTKKYEKGTTIDREHITSSVHTQVVDQDLIDSKLVFNPSGPQSEPVSIAHLTPAQLVSQLATCTKPWQNQDIHHSQHIHSSQYSRRNPRSSYPYGAGERKDEAYYKYPY